MFQLRLADGRTVTLHMWGEIRTLWVSGDGKRFWFDNDFHDVFARTTGNPTNGESEFANGNCLYRKQSLSLSLYIYIYIAREILLIL